MPSKTSSTSNISTNIFMDMSMDKTDTSMLDIVSVSKRLCSQAEKLRVLLQESVDDDLSSAVKIAETAVGNDVIVPLLAMVQCVDRDAENDFRPIVRGDKCNSSVALTDMADVALLTLNDLYMVAETFLTSNGWFPVDLSTSVKGGIVYEHEGTGEKAEEPEVHGITWQMKLMLSIPVLTAPGCVDGRAVWAAAVVYYQRLQAQEHADLQQFDLEWKPTGGSSCVAVVDVLKSDEDGDSARMRGTYHGCWLGLYADAVGEMDIATSIGQVLESWTDNTLTGLSITKSSARVLVLGLASGQLISFLQKHNPTVQLIVVEASTTAVDIAVKYYRLHPSVLDCVSVVDPLEYVKSQCLEGGEFDTIVVNVCSIEETFPTFLLNGTFFDGLMSMLSNHPSATLLVNSGVSVDTVVALVDDACKQRHGHRHGHMIVLREYLLRDHADIANEGVIVAARQRQWSLSVADWQREYMGEQVQSSGAMPVADAQRTQVVRLEKFLSMEEIQLIQSVAKDALIFPSGVGVQVHTDSWKVLYLQNNDVFRRKLPVLRGRILEAIRTVDKCNWSLFDNVEHVHIRVVEYHHMDEFGELADPKHYDLNSLLTMDIMLSEEGAFEGGDLQTEEADGTLKKHEFKQGDALVFVSHKPHCVGRVRAGRRNVMVLEFWYGPERQCPHRCERFGQEICAKDPAQHLYTQEHPHPQREHQLEQDNTPSIPLPFRLGSVSMCKEGSREILELLWEPNGEVEVVPDKLTSVSEEVEANMDEVWDLFD
jgi:hypothetical protein